LSRLGTWNPVEAQLEEAGKSGDDHQRLKEAVGIHAANSKVVQAPKVAHRFLIVQTGAWDEHSSLLQIAS